LSRMHEVFSEGVVDELRRETGYNPRQRRATAYRLLLCCVEACLFGKTLGFAAIQAFFVKRFGPIRRRAFQLRFKSAAAVRFFRAALDRVIGRAVTEAGRQLFAVSRAAKKKTNDADRIRNYLARFDLSWADVRTRNQARTQPAHGR
jgi:hypothetical protein